MPSPSHPTDALSRDRSGGSSAARRTRRRPRRRVVPILATIVISLVLGSVLAIAAITDRSMRELTRESLRSILSANVAALNIWLEQRRDDAGRLANQSDVDRASKELLTRFGLQGEPAPRLPGRDPLYESLLRSMTLDATYHGWLLLDLDGRIVASSHEHLDAIQLPVPADALERMIEGKTTVCRPFKIPVPLTDEGPLSIGGGALMLAMAPIADGAQSVGCLALMMDPVGGFSELLSIARSGGSGETYAIDRRGVLISQSRFEHQLRAAGLLDHNPLVASPLNVSVRDPGCNLTRGGQTDLPRELQPMTFMADQATRGATGENIDGYNDYRGVPVIGAWRWLSEYGIGVATEIDVAEAYRPIRLLNRSVLGLLGFTVTAGAGVLALSVIYRRMADPLRWANHDSRRLGQYELGRLVGRGGMGTVYRGKHDLLRRDVAIKVLERDDAHPHAISRFEREVQLTARLRHPNTIAIYDYGRTTEGAFFYVMEYIDGITLEELVTRYGRQSPERVIYLLLQVCGSLSEAHQQGLVHRDIKPANILLTAHAGIYDMIKVLDFGLVKEIDSDTLELTSSDAITGTPMYMSPESVRDAATANEQSDLYSVGAVGYTLLTGLPTFEGDSSIDICLKQLNEEPVRPSDRVGQPLPDDLQNVLMSCLRKDPDERPSSVDELADALQQCEDARAWTSVEALRWWEEIFEPAPVGAVEGGNATVDGQAAEPDEAAEGNGIDTDIQSPPQDLGGNAHSQQTGR